MKTPRGYQLFFAELKRRKVFRVAAGYGAVAFVIIQAADVMFPRIPLPEWTISFVVWLCILGFPVALVLAWVFERSASGLQRTPEAPEAEIHAIVAEPVSRRWPSGVAALAGSALLVAGVYTAWQVAVPEEVGITEARLAVFPFGVAASGNLEWLNNGLPSLLSQNLFEPGETETVDPVQVINSATRAGGPTLDLPSAADVSRDLGAGRFVVGSVSGAGATVRISAGLYALRDSIHSITRGEVEGDTTDLFTLVDQLTAQLLGNAEEFGAANLELVRSAAHTTESLTALKAYLEGEAYLRSGDMDEARESFGAAVEEDSTFALAMYRNAFAHLIDYENRNNEAADWAHRAGRFSNHLSTYDRQTLEAFTQHIDGRITEAEQSYGALIRSYPSRLDAKVLLTLLRADYDPLRGRSIDRTVNLFSQVKEADPGYLCLTCLQGQILHQQEDEEAIAQARVERIEADDDSAYVARALPRARAVLALVRGDTAEWNAARRDLLPTFKNDTTHNHDTGNIIFAALDAGRPALADTLTNIDFADADTYGIPTFIDIVRGRWQAVYDSTATYDEPDNLVSLVRRYGLNLPRDASLPNAADLIATCLAWDGPVMRNPTLLDALSQQVRFYGAAMLSFQIDDLEAALAFADSIEALPVDSMRLPLVRNLVRGVRGEAALRAGDVTTARAHLEELEWEMAPAVADGASTLGFARWHFLRGEAALLNGDIEEARRWFYDGLAKHNASEYVNLETRRGQIQEALGNIEQARIHYARVVEALEPADPEVRPLGDLALERLSALLEADS